LTSGSEITIGVDARAASEVPAGRGRVVRELLLRLAERPPQGTRFLLYTRRRWEPLAEDARFAWRELDSPDPWWHVRAARAANRECDVFLSCNSYLTLWFLRVPGVPIVYDLVAFERSMHANRRSTLIERVTLGTAVRRAGALLAISQATADALCARFPRARGRTVVAHLGVAPELTAVPEPAEAGELPPPGFVLAVGTLEPRKNLPRLVAAYQRLDRELQGLHPLVVVGARGWQTGPTLEALRALGERCVMLGYVSDAVLAELYRRCAVFCYPSLGEGFGLPVLEAMAAGAAVITSNLSSLPEVGGDAVEYVEPHDVQDIAARLDRLLRMPERRAELSALARERARLFSWETFAELTLETLRRAASHG
jgi:alpha-1,3-rhamnosyl/mannosyltransferase